MFHLFSVLKLIQNHFQRIKDLIIHQCFVLMNNLLFYSSISSVLNCSDTATSILVRNGVNLHPILFIEFASYSKNILTELSE